MKHFTLQILTLAVGGTHIVTNSSLALLNAAADLAA
jgi:hypothetical protein